MADTSISFFSVLICLFFLGLILYIIFSLSKKKAPISSQTIQQTSNPIVNIKEPSDPVDNRKNKSIASGSSRYQITVQTNDFSTLSKEDQIPENYQSINVHGHSIYDIPAPRSSSTDSGLNWSGKGGTINVQGFSIKNPLTYWSRSDSLDASCIVKGLKVEIPDDEKLPPLPYWPQYSGLTPAQRGKYLLWLSQGRNDNLDEIGYAFIFFYGLERRAILEKMDHEVILTEVSRLLSRYPISGSFTSYLNHFMAYVVGFRLAEMKDQDLKKIFPDYDSLDDYPTKVILSWHWSNRLPLPWDLCYSFSKNSADFPKTNITRKAPALLKQLFRKKFSEQFPKGIPPSSEYDQFQLNYKPASQSLLRYVGYSGNSGLIEPLKIPLPRLDALPFETIRRIWTNCIEELKPVSNKIGLTDDKITREVYSALPDTLKSEIPHPDLESWHNLLSTKQLVDGSIILQVSDIANQIGIEKRDILTTTQSKTVTSAVRDFGWVLVPDQMTSGTSYRWNDAVAIVPTGDKKQTVSNKFQSAVLIFEIAHGIAASDEEVSDVEENYLHRFVSEQFSLNDLERECLKGVQKVLEAQPPSLSRIGKRLSKHLNTEQKLVLANFLGEIVLLDDKFVKEEQKALKTVFKSLEIDPTVSDELIKKLLVGHTPEEPITVVKPGRAGKGEPIPQPVKPEFIIDKEKLRQTMEDTRAVQGILASVFQQEQEEIVIEMEPEVKVPVPPVKPDPEQMDINLPFPPETVPALDAKYLLMLHDIMKSNELSQDDFNGLARKHNVMPRAAFDDINSWADEELGDFLLEESESRIVINYKK